MKVPEGWSKKTLEDIANVSSGGTPSRGKPEYWNGAIPWVTTAEIDFCEIFDTTEKITQDGLNNSSAKLFPIGTVLLAMYGQGKTRGKVAKLGIEATTNQACAAIVFKHNFCVDYYYQYLRSQYDNIRNLSNSGSQENLSGSIVKSIQVPAPPLPEQQKIAQILSTWDNAIATCEQLLANSQQQKKALMQQLLTGKKRLLDEGGVRFGGGWKFLTFDDVYKVVNKKSVQIKSSQYRDSGTVPIVDQGQKLIAGYCNSVERYTNVPVIIFGDHTRCIKWIDFEFCLGADGTQALETTKWIDLKYGYYLLTNTRIPNLGYSRHMRELKEKDFKITVQIQEQQKIATTLTTADREIELLSTQLETLKQEKKALMQQLLTGKRRVIINH